MPGCTRTMDSEAPPWSSSPSPPRQRGPIARAARWCLAALLFAMPLAFLRWGPRPALPCELVVDMAVGQSPQLNTGVIEIWINDTKGEPLRQPSTPGVRRSYRFALKDNDALKDSSSIHYMRLDPTDRAAIVTRLYGIRIEYHGETLRSFSARELASWWNNCEIASLQDDALVLHAQHSDPAMQANFPVIELPVLPAHRPLQICWDFLFAEDTPARQVLVLSLALAAVLVLGFLGGPSRLQTIIVGLSIPMTYVAVSWLHERGGTPPDGHAAIGYACYMGCPKSLDAWKVMTFVAVPALIALGAVWWTRRLGGSRTPAPWTCPTPSSGVARWSRVLLVALVAAGLMGYFFPSLAALHDWYLSPRNLTNWDEANCLVWQYLIQTGAKPFSDFWYPYFGQWLFNLPFPYGEICSALCSLLLFTVLFLGIFWNTGRSARLTLVIFGVVFALYAAGLFVFPDRYGLVANVLLAYAAIDRETRRWQWRHVVFWLAVVQLGVIEPAGIIYAGVPIAATCLLEALRGPAVFLRQLPGRLVQELAVPAAAFTGLTGWLALQGQLRGILAFFASLGTMSDYAGLPVELPLWLRFGSPLESFLIWSLVVLTGLGCSQLFARDASARKAGQVLFLLGMATGMVLLKQFVRPHIAQQLLIIPVIGTLFFVFEGFRRFNIWQQGAVFLAGGLLVASLAVSQGPHIMRLSAVSVADRVRLSRPFWRMRHRDRQAMITARFAPARFVVSEGHRAVLRVLNDLFAAEGKQPYFVLSDDPIFYLLTQSRPYFHTNFYSTAPIAEQQHLIRLLESNPPRLVIWRPSDLGIDGVPPLVRDPLLFEYVIDHYIPQATIHQFEVLRPRLPQEAVAIDFWRAKLGNVLNLNNIPRFSGISRLKEVSGRNGEEIAECLTVRVPDPSQVPVAPGLQLPQYAGYHATGQPVAIPVECAGRQFSLVLAVVPGQSEYHVLLNRVWFWGALRKAGLLPALGKVGPGIEVSIVQRADPNAILY